MKPVMSSKERMLAAIRRQEVDYVPLCTSFSESQSADRKLRTWQREEANGEHSLRYQVEELGIDPVVYQHIAPGQHPDVTSRVWEEPISGAPHPILHKEIMTPAGPLTAAIRPTDDWPHGRDIPLQSDFNVSRFIKPWLKTLEDVERWAYVHTPPADREIAVAREEAERVSKYAQRWELATATPIGYGLTAAHQLFGVDAIYVSLDNPEVIDRFLEIEHQTTMRRLEIAFDPLFGVDIVVRNGFYETTDFWSPKQLRDFLGQRLREEIGLVHGADRACSYTICTGIMPILDDLAELPFDALAAIEPVLGNQDMKMVAQKIGGKCIWGGVSAPVHIGEGTPEIVRNAVREAFDVFGKKGFILHAVPSIRQQWPWENVLAFIDEWKRLCIAN